MKGILFVNWVNNIHGAVIDVIDYYLTILEYNKDFKLVILNYNPEFQKILTNLIKDRYEVDDLDFEKNIIGVQKKIDLIRFLFDRLIILDYGTIKGVKGFVFNKDKNSKIFIISDLHTDKPDYFIKKELFPDGVLQYYGEMPFVYKDVQYTQKLLFSRLKPLRKVEPNIFLHSPENDDYSFLETLDLPKDKKIIYKTHTHKENLFELFDTFIYYHANKWFDPRPRLMLESYYYKKEIQYYNVPNIKDGSYYRYKDLMKNGIEHRHLNKNDEIVKQCI